jgi:hypothetical protein
MMSDQNGLQRAGVSEEQDNIYDEGLHDYRTLAQAPEYLLALALQ